MQRFDFTLWLADDPRDLDEWSHAVYEAGGDDSSCGERDGKLFAIFHREAESLEDAIRSAHRTVQAAGLRILRLEIEAEEMTWANV